MHLLHRWSLASALVLAWAACSPNDASDPDARTPSRDGGSRVDARDVDEENLEWRAANLTNFTSYPEPGSEECEDFNGCEWAGRFAFLDEQQSEAWVMANNIAAVHSRDGDTYALKTLRVRSDDLRVDVTVYDVCSDSDCGGCCTRNAQETGFLIDLEHYTAERFGMWHGVVEFACLDCE
jgi:hypothetical protein